MDSNKNIPVKGKITKLNINPTSDLIKKWENEINIEMQLNFECVKFTKGEMKIDTAFSTIDEIADLFGLNANVATDLKTIKNLRQEMMKEILIKRPQTKLTNDHKMVATIKNSITSEALNNVEQSNGYDDMIKFNNPYKLYLFIVDVIIHKTNSRNPIQTTTELMTNLYSIKQGPTETINDYSFRMSSVLDILERSIERVNNFYTENNIEDKFNSPGLYGFLYIVLRGLNDNHSSFKIDIANRIMINKGLFPYKSVNDLLNAAADFCATTNNKGKTFLKFSTNNTFRNTNVNPKTLTKCEHCRKKGHSEENCWEKYPEKKIGYTNNQISKSNDKHESNNTPRQDQNNTPRQDQSP
jgi:hypothetical protein